MNKFARHLRAEEIVDATETMWTECMWLKSRLVAAGIVPLAEVDKLVDTELEKAVVGLVGQEKVTEARKVFAKFAERIPPSAPRPGRMWRGD